jgi:hypothetical protein
MPLYEVLLIRKHDRETRLTDQALSIGETVSIGQERWLVESEATPDRTEADTRYVCIRSDDTH